jgi:hypothetical protein
MGMPWRSRAKLQFPLCQVARRRAVGRLLCLTKPRKSVLPAPTSNICIQVRPITFCPLDRSFWAEEFPAADRLQLHAILAPRRPGNLLALGELCARWSNTHRSSNDLTTDKKEAQEEDFSSSLCGGGSFCVLRIATFGSLPG